MFRKILIAGALIGAALAGALAQGTLQGGISGTDSKASRQIFQMGIPRVTREETITATAGGGQTSAYQLTFGLNRVTTVGTAGDSVKLPNCSGGLLVVVINAAASNSLNVFGQTGDTINALSANTAYAIAANKMVIFACANNGNWYTNLTASLGQQWMAANDNHRQRLRRAA